MSGKDEPNPALWLATRAGNMALPWPLGITRFVPQEKKMVFFFPYNKSFIDQAWGQDGWILALFLFYMFMDLDLSWPLNSQKNVSNCSYFWLISLWF